MKKSPPLPIRSIQLDLGEALGELEDLWARIQIAAFGKILAKELEPRKEYADRLAKRLPLTDSDLFYPEFPYSRVKPTSFLRFCSEVFTT